MSKTKRRIEITAFRRQVANTDRNPEPPAQSPSRDVDESLAAEIFALVKGLTGEKFGSAWEEASSKLSRTGDDHGAEIEN